MAKANEQKMYWPISLPMVAKALDLISKSPNVVRWEISSHYCLDKQRLFPIESIILY
jgi:hypothetical protein